MNNFCSDSLHLCRRDMMKKILSIIAIFGFLLGSQAFADDKADALAFFNRYVNAANTYSPTVPDFYSPNAKIIRQVVKPDGTTANAYTNTSTYITQLKIGQATAKMRKYKNAYRNITVAKVANGYKVSAERQPTGETYWLKVYQIIQKQPNGKWLIVEELMQTKEQIFLRYAK